MQTKEIREIKDTLQTIETGLILGFLFTLAAIVGLLVGVIIIGVRDPTKNTTNITNDLIIDSFTSAIGSSTINFTLISPSQSAYARIGNLIFVTIHVRWNGTNSVNPASSIRILLPFPVATATVKQNAFAIGEVLGLAFGNSTIVAVVDTVLDPNRMFLLGFTNLVVPPLAFPLNCALAGTTGLITVTGSYITDVF